MPSGVPAGLLALAGSGQLGQVPLGRQPTFQSALTGSLGLLSQAQQGQGQRGDRQFDQMLQIAEMEQQIRQAEAAQAQAAQQREIQQTYIQSLPEGQRAQAAAFPKIFAGEQAKARFRESKGVGPLKEVFDAASPSGSRWVTAEEAVGLPAAGAFAGTGLTPGKAEELGAEAGGLRLAQTKLQALRDDLEANPQRAGAVGSVNKALQTGGGIARDVVEMIPGVASITDSLLGPATADESEEVQDFLNDPSIEANQAAANSLAYALALSRKQGKRVTVQDVATARDDLKVTGLKSSKQIVARMDELMREIDQGIGLIEKRIGTGGQSVTQAIPRQQQLTVGDLEGLSDAEFDALEAEMMRAGNP